jgi:signal peptidase I
LATTAERKTTGRHEKPQRSFLLELPGLLLAALLVAVVIKTFLIQPFYIPSRSMVPELLVNDRVMVSKVNLWFGDAVPGDIVVFRNPSTPLEEESVPERVVRAVLEALGIRTNGTEDLIKRVVAVGGQTVEIRDNQVVIDGTPLAEDYLPEGVFMSDMAPRLIQEGQLWMMGDNRNESSDSRVFGPIDEETVIGEAVVRIWPLDRIGGL